MNEEPSCIHRGQNSNAAELLPATLIARARATPIAPGLTPPLLARYFFALRGASVGFT